MRRRDFLRFLLATPIAATVDVEQLLWVPKPIVTVPAMPTDLAFHPDAFKLAIGDIITLEGRYGIHPITRERLGHLQRFVVTSDVLYGVARLQPEFAMRMDTENSIDFDEGDADDRDEVGLEHSDAERGAWLGGVAPDHEEQVPAAHLG